MNIDLMFSSKTDNWATPQDFFDCLNSQYHFTLDPCADDKNHKCDQYFTKEIDWLSQKWSGRVFCNPPYGREMKNWIKKSSEESKNCEIIILLIPARTDTSYFHDYIYGHEDVDIEFIRWRLKFGDSKNCAPFPSMLVTFKNPLQGKYGEK